MGVIYEEGSVWLFVLVTVVLGGGAAWMTGRAVASGWDSLYKLAFYLVLLTVAVRFIHHALFGGTMLTPRYYIADAVILFIFGFLGFRFTRASQMATQYSWMYERTGPLTWRERNAGRRA